MATIYTHIAANKRRSAMLIVVVLLVLLGVGWAVDTLTDGGSSFLALAAVLAVVMTLIGYYGGDRVALWTAGAEPITKEDNPYLFRMVENLAMTAGLPMPKLYILRDEGLNAFATGRDPRHASIAVTAGSLERLENEELEGVLAHELSHIGNFDIRFMTLVAVLVGVIVLLSDIFLRTTLWGGSRRRSGGGGVLALFGLLLILLSPIIAQLIKLAVSRKREYLADASGALLTRYPEGLASALEKIAGSSEVHRASNATAHLFIANPFGRAGHGLARFFATHPPIEERIRILRSMGGGAGTPSN